MRNDLDRKKTQVAESSTHPHALILALQSAQTLNQALTTVERYCFGQSDDPSAALATDGGMRNAHLSWELSVKVRRPCEPVSFHGLYTGWMTRYGERFVRSGGGWC